MSLVRITLPEELYMGLVASLEVPSIMHVFFVSPEFIWGNLPEFIWGNLPFIWGNLPEFIWGNLSEFIWGKLPEFGGVVLFVEYTGLVADGDPVTTDLVLHVGRVAGAVKRDQETPVT